MLITTLYNTSKLHLEYIIQSPYTSRLRNFQKSTLKISLYYSISHYGVHVTAFEICSYYSDTACVKDKRSRTTITADLKCTFNMI